MNTDDINNAPSSVDIIGDVHGCYDELVSLLEKRGYAPVDGIWQHPERKALLMGDLINRGTMNLAVLELVKAMHQNGKADVICGNHEFNFIAWHTRTSSGEFVRSHHAHNHRQLKNTLEEFDAQPHLLETYLGWMKTLPLFMETSVFRAVHACWDDELISKAKRGAYPINLESEAFIREAATPGTDSFFYLERLLKGPEYRLGRVHQFKDNDGNLRRAVRVKWWNSDQPLANILLNRNDVNVPDNERFRAELPKVMTDKPTFIGHYCLGDAEPAPLTEHLICVDYCVYRQKRLVGYELGVGFFNSKG